MTEWIKASKLPVKDKMVLVWYKSKDGGRGYHGQAFYGEDENMWLKGNLNRANDVWATVSHWMPLPEPPID